MMYMSMSSFSVSVYCSCKSRTQRVMQ